jgi:phosphatidylglycerophosphate synthase
LTPTTTLKRIQENMLAVHERRLLNWICPRLPSWVTPDSLTALGLIGAVIVFVGYGASALDVCWLWASVAGYVVHWFGDSLDGSLARFRSIERPRYGYFVDHSADALGVLFIVGGLGLSPFVRLDVALVALAGYYLLAIHSFLAARIIGELKLSYISAGPTELRLILIGLTVAMYAFRHSGPRWMSLGPFDIFVGLIGVLLILLFVIQTSVMARRLARQGE